MALVVVVACLLFLLSSSGASPARVSPVSASMLSKARLEELASRGVDTVRAHSERIAVVRVPGTPAIKKVREYIVSQLKALKVFDVTVDEFTDSTPLGDKQFANIVATYNPGNKSRVVWAAHYDSKWFKAPTEFVAATDSAVPCAILLDLAVELAAAVQHNQVAWGVQLVFFDGEEAFLDWTATDSLYGARHMAAQWQQQGMLESVQLFVLLDLLGDGSERFLDWFPRQTGLQHRELGLAVRRLRSAGLLEGKGPAVVPNRMGYGGISDDHEPFLQRGVPVLHLISFPFPNVWHKPEDNLSAVNWKSTRDLTIVFRVYLASILNLTSLNQKQEEL